MLGSYSTSFIARLGRLPSYRDWNFIPPNHTCPPIVGQLLRLLDSGSNKIDILVKPQYWYMLSYPSALLHPTP